MYSQSCQDSRRDPFFRAELAPRAGRYFSDQYWPDNGSGPWRGTVNVFAAKVGVGAGGADLLRTETRTAQIAKALESFTYDLDGNLTGDGIWNYQWDAENRLVRAETNALAVSFGIPHRIIEYAYDYRHRRVEKKVTNGATSVTMSHHRYVYDGWNLIAEIDQLSSGSISRSFTWGLDLTGSLTATGGVGALLEIRDNVHGKTLLPTYDGNGNVVSLVNAATSGGGAGAIEAVYEYSPFGELLRRKGAYADHNPFRFSTKFSDTETGLIYYGFRYYDPRNGRFIGRDPIEESGGVNLYGFVANQPISGWDYLGMLYWDISEDGSGAVEITFYYDTDAGQETLGSHTLSGRQGLDSLIQQYQFNNARSAFGSRGTLNVAAMLESRMAVSEFLAQTRGRSVAIDPTSLYARGRGMATVTIGELQSHDGGSLSDAPASVPQSAPNSTGINVMPNVPKKRTAIVIVGKAEVVGWYADPAPAMSTSTRGFWDDATPDQIARAYGAAWGKQHAQRRDDWGAIVNASRGTFGNAVFQQPIRTLATAGAQATILVGSGYMGVAVAPAAYNFAGAATLKTGALARTAYTTTLVTAGSPVGQRGLQIVGDSVAGGLARGTPFPPSVAGVLGATADYFGLLDW